MSIPNFNLRPLSHRQIFDKDDFRICGHLALVDKAGVTKEPRASGMMAQSKVFTHKKAQLSGRA
jgi:hypothetical protein